MESHYRRNFVDLVRTLSVINHLKSRVAGPIRAWIGADVSQRIKMENSDGGDGDKGDAGSEKCYVVEDGDDGGEGDNERGDDDNAAIMPEDYAGAGDTRIITRNGNDDGSATEVKTP